MDNIADTLRQVAYNISVMRLHDVVDILLVAALIYFVISLIRKTRSRRVFQGIFILLIVLWLSGELQLYTTNFILRNTVQIGLIALVVLFQPEIRRVLEKLGTGTSLRALFQNTAEPEAETWITQIVIACCDMSATKTGALIIFERDNKLDDQIRTGTVLNADITAELLKNIFFAPAPLHDGAVIVRNGRICAAGCMLPLSNNSNLSRELGMRHRAGIGMSENSDAVVAIVSEETGSISVAKDGMLKRHLTRDTFEKVLRNELSAKESESPKRRFRVRRKEDAKNG